MVKLAWLGWVGEGEEEGKGEEGGGGGRERGLGGRLSSLPFLLSLSHPLDNTRVSTEETLVS